MSNAEEIAAGVEELEVNNTNYKAPAKKTLDEINKLDAGDESLNKYKAALLGDMNDIAYDKNDSRKVIVTEIQIHSPDLKAPAVYKTAELADKVVIIKEGAMYHIEVKYHVQHEIVSGLKYNHNIKRKGIPVDKVNEMIGSYAPRKDIYTYKTEEEEAPSGMLARGEYKVDAFFSDDDKVKHFEFAWKFKISKNWEAKE